jgi:DNA-binding NtrC family response regulator
LLLAASNEHGTPPAILRQWAVAAGAECEYAPDLPRAVRLTSTTHWDAVIVLLGDRPEEEMAWWMEALRPAVGRPRLIALAQRASMGLVLRAERMGVFDVLRLPLHRPAVERVLERLRAKQLAAPLALPPAEIVGRFALVGRSEPMLAVYRELARAAASTTTVLLQGESGTGKEVAARAIHENGPRAAARFVAVNCAAIPENLLESELFGHEKGAFTGAVARRIGRFEQASGGTLFLDEVADLSLPLQAKILRALQEHEIERLGGGETIPVDVRVIAASNRDLRAAIAAGRFREDLYYRLAVLVIRLPPLRERGDDLMLLVSHFADQFARASGKAIHCISDRAQDALRQHDWVGNVRELRNVIERAVVLASDDTIRLGDLPDELRGAGTGGAPTPPRGFPSLDDVAARHIARALERTGGQVAAAAELLGIHRNTLTRKIREYGL